MILKQRLDQRQVQKLILAPALQQAIKLLPLTNLELVEVIDEEMAENPLLELEEEAPERAADADAEAETGSGDASPGEEKPDSAAEPEAAPDAGTENGDDAEFESYFQEYFDDGFRSLPHETREVPSIENTLPSSSSLWDHLTWQANLTFFDPADREIAERIIGNVNEDGYLVSPPEELAGAAGTTVDRVEAVRAKIRMFDPVGVASLDLKECLLSQMDHLQIRDETARAIIAPAQSVQRHDEVNREVLVAGHVYALAAGGAASLRCSEHACRFDDHLFRYASTFRHIGKVEAFQGCAEFIHSAHGVQDVFPVVEFFVQDDPDHACQEGRVLSWLHLQMKVCQPGDRTSPGIDHNEFHAPFLAVSQSLEGV